MQLDHFNKLLFYFERFALHFRFVSCAVEEEDDDGEVVELCFTGVDDTNPNRWVVAEEGAVGPTEIVLERTVAPVNGDIGATEARRFCLVAVPYAILCLIGVDATAAALLRHATSATFVCDRSPGLDFTDFASDADGRQNVPMGLRLHMLMMSRCGTDLPDNLTIGTCFVVHCM